MCTRTHHRGHRVPPGVGHRGAEGGLPPQAGHRRVDRDHEPDRAAGRLRRRALAPPRPIPEGDGTYLITGTKIFISFGEHDMAENIIHLVLARLPDAPAGTKGISLFIVPEVPGERRRHARGAQRRALRLDRAQDGHPRLADLRHELRRRGRRRRLPRRRGEPGHAGHVHDDERGARSPSASRASPSATPPTRRRWRTPRSAARAARSAATATARPDHRAPRRAPDAADHDAATSRPCAR